MPIERTSGINLTGCEALTVAEKEKEKEKRTDVVETNSSKRVQPLRDLSGLGGGKEN